MGRYIRICTQNYFLNAGFPLLQYLLFMKYIDIYCDAIMIHYNICQLSFENLRLKRLNHNSVFYFIETCLYIPTHRQLTAKAIRKPIADLKSP